MKITEVRIVKKDNQDKRLRAFATITFDDCFVVRDIKIIDGKKGLFIAMPSRRVKEPCTKCGNRNAVRSLFCGFCGTRLREKLEEKTAQEWDEAALRQSEHKDIAHPITVECREYIQKTILEAFHQACKELNHKESLR